MFEVELNLVPRPTWSPNARMSLSDPAGGKLSIHTEEEKVCIFN